MEQIRKTEKHLIFKKGSGRYAVKDSKTKQWINGDAKADILVAEALITRSQPKPPAPESSDQASSDQASPDQASPDQASPDQASPDQASPDQASPAETSAGIETPAETASESQS